MKTIGRGRGEEVDGSLVGEDVRGLHLTSANAERGPASKFPFLSAARTSDLIRQKVS